jgi:transposase
LARWSTLDAIKKVRKQTLFNFFNQHNSRYPAVNKKRYSDIKAAQSLTNDPGVIEPNRIMVEEQIAQFKLLIESIDRMDRETRLLYKKLEDRNIFDSFPGAGAQLAPRLLVAFGSNRDRYHSASELQKYAGIAPVIEQSGKQKWVHWRYNCPTFLRQTFVEWAGLTIRYSFWAKAYYEQQISKGKPHNTVIRALAFKWIRIAYRCWKTNKPYNESTYLNALKKRGSPLLNYAINK